ncbi:MAG: hypothetical protein ACLQAT_06975 [Candidatus Binataceae bacterium]
MTDTATHVDDQSCNLVESPPLCHQREVVHIPPEVALRPKIRLGMETL